jgi:hypothetical protein
MNYNKRLTITNWVGTGTNRVGQMSYLPTPDKGVVRLDVRLDYLTNQPKVETLFLSESQLRHMKPDGDNYTMSFQDFNDPA